VKRFSARVGFLQACFAIALALVLVRAGQLQLAQGARWAREAEARRTERDTLEARRGSIYDRRGVQLAVTQEFFHVGIAPNEVKERRALIRVAARQLRVGAGELERRFRRDKYIYFYGPYTATQVEPLRRFRGVHLDGSFRRDYPSSLAAPVIGRLDPDSSRGGSGLERALDRFLTGVPGEAVFLRDRSGKRLESPARKVRDPVAGNDVWLTLDAELQDIAERELEDAIDELDAVGGDVVIVDPRSGDVLAVASRQARVDRAASRPTAFTDPFEPGSTAKLFTAAALLRGKKVDSNDRVSGENGTWDMPVGKRGRVRTIRDVHKEAGHLTLADAIKVSSNIAMAKFSQRLTTTEQYETLRDFGFGSPTGVEYPSESRGELRMPEEWLPDYSRASMAMGYEVGVTALQLALAYASIANDGVLMTPSLVREVRDPAGQLLYRHRPEPVRRVLPSALAATLQQYLADVVDSGGTGDLAQLATFQLAGKTGTARRFVNNRYEGYRASFAGIFPAKDPQLVIVVRIEAPTKGSYYGGAVAAPLTKRVLEQALASRHIAIDRRRLASVTPGIADAAPRGVSRADVVVPVARVAVPLKAGKAGKAGESAGVPVVIPEVAGQGVRAAVLELHRRGVKVSLRGTGTAVRTEPSAGTAVREGSTVVLWTAE
jgi:cell division protein FtsI (penicillin-binding protein 3)